MLPLGRKLIHLEIKYIDFLLQQNYCIAGLIKNMRFTHCNCTKVWVLPQQKRYSAAKKSALMVKLQITPCSTVRPKRCIHERFKLGNCCTIWLVMRSLLKLRHVSLSHRYCKEQRGHSHLGFSPPTTLAKANIWPPPLFVFRNGFS